MIISEITGIANTVAIERDALDDSPKGRQRRGDFILKLFQLLSSVGLKLILCRGKLPIGGGHPKSLGLSFDEAKKIVDYYKKGHCLPSKQGFVVEWKLVDEPYDPKKAKTGYNCLNIGVLTWPSNVYVVDVDVKRERKNGVEGWKKISEGMPDKTFFTVNTGSGGFHCYFKQEGDFDGILFNQTIPGIDLLCKDNGGSRYVISPGSVHPCGKAYYIAEDSLIEIPRMSKEMNKRLREVILEYQTAKGVVPTLSVSPSPTAKKQRTYDMTKDQMEDMLMNGLAERRSDDRDGWLRVIWAIKSVDPLYIDLAKKFSMRTPRKYNEKDLNEQWDSGDVNRENAITWGTVMYYCREDNEEFYEKWLREVMGSITSANPLTWRGFTKLFHGRILTSQEEWERIQKARLVIAYIIDGNRSYYVIKNEGVLIKQSRRAAKDGMNGINYTVKVRVGDKEKLIHKKLFSIIEMHNHLFTYGSAEFHPYSPKQPATLSPDTLNLFGGYKVTHLPAYDEKKIELIKKHLREVWCNSDNAVFEYLLKLKAHQVQYPRSKAPIHTVVYSNIQGVGKNIFGEWEINYVFGRNLAIKVDRMHQISGQFNAICENMLYIILDEADARRKADWDVLKSFTSIQGIIEAKGVDPRWCNNYATLLFFSNHDSPVKLEPNDRRYFILQASGIYAKDKEYWIALAAVLHQDTADHWYTYLMSMDLFGWDYGEIPLTEARASLLKSSEHIVHTWIDAFGWHVPPSSATELKEMFVQFCERGGYDGEKRIDPGQFAKKMREHPKMRWITTHGTNHKYYHVDHQ